MVWIRTSEGGRERKRGWRKEEEIRQNETKGERIGRKGDREEVSKSVRKE